ncbi:mast cell protease 1A-like [Polyodon spathula]|nr:mast cell protease 1A-like [Polyodon spathula]
MVPLHLLSILLLMPVLTSAGVLQGGIIGGHDAKPHSRPYMAYVVLKRTAGTSNCGGFLVREDFVMTAAHCQARKIYVLLGAHDLTQNEPSQVLVDVKESIPHPDYSSDNLAHDIMLLKLNGKVKLSDSIAVLPLPDSEADLKGKSECLLSGWGNTARNGTNNPHKLQEVNVTVLDRDKCNQSWGDKITKEMICTASRRGGCKGDSGSPLVCGGVAHGVVSFGVQPCGLHGFPHIYTRIAEYLPWISKVLNSSCKIPGAR